MKNVYRCKHKAEVRPNFLESEVGLVLKTREIPASMGVQDGKYKIVKAGTPFPSDNSNAVGIVFEDIDVTDGNMPGSVMVAGRVLADRLSLASAAKTALSGKGFTFVDAPEITRGYTVTYDKTTAAARRPSTRTSTQRAPMPTSRPNIR